MAQKLTSSQKLDLARKEAERAGLWFFGRKGRFYLCRKGMGVIGSRSSEGGLLILVRRAMRAGVC